ncbi:hypothetical protein NECAME_02519 [Necator americanus]|uniref:Uncharacterized protein n=1 Tax=Necator americanus TaxID=51031 RepID=W2TDB4_NECAM|nr:hypothetical protein NECAME_02519 [Necator americanus]ETN80040.1 hypothetical protein NECAME_02519 [Necator americanus]
MPESRNSAHVNHEATLGQSFGGVALETAINQEGAERMLTFSNRFSVSQGARDAVMELVNVNPTFDYLQPFGNKIERNLRLKQVNKAICSTCSTKRLNESRAWTLS